MRDKTGALIKLPDDVLLRRGKFTVVEVQFASDKRYRVEDRFGYTTGVFSTLEKAQQYCDESNLRFALLLMVQGTQAKDHI